MSTAPATFSESVEHIIDEFSVTPNPHPASEADRNALIGAPKFGTVFTDHMAAISWSRTGGWDDHRIVPYGPLAMDPATAVLHYGQEIFEGLKAYRHADGSTWTFRPEANAARMKKSAARMALPELPTDDFLAAVAGLVRTDQAWVPTFHDSALYLRPFMFASEPFLGVRSANEVEFMVIASPVGPYFSGGVRPVSIWLCRTYHRAGPGGTGAAKCGGNYAASLLPQEIAASKGFDQVCFLDGGEGTYLEELGGMNIFLVKADGSVHTPELTGSILEGVTRSSILQLATDRGHQVVERKIPVTELQEGIVSGEITEVFACGTAAVITPIGRMAGQDFDSVIADGDPGTLTMALREELTGIQYGLIPDRHGWMQRLA
ncbi:MAG: branched-chain amino acid aminotransferase [Cellulomonadaceae bacterium]|jgi:branched-chain amino acid aminotransferase|nr:branched-chain amino acid aminotransferase [Cellulomonadaceae bacterium]